MPRITYTNQPNKRFELLPDGKYLLRIKEADPCISQAPKYRGADQIEFKFESVENGATFNEWLTFHPELEWKVDNFITCFNYGAEPGQEIEVEAERCIGLRGWCEVGHYEKNGKTYNQIKVYYTDHEKFPRPALPAGGAIPAEASNDPWEQ